MATEVKNQSCVKWWRRGEEMTKLGAEVREMETGHHDIAVFIEQVIGWIEDREEVCLLARPPTKHLQDLAHLNSGILELLGRVALLADPSTQKKIYEFQSQKRGSSVGIERESDSERKSMVNRHNMIRCRIANKKVFIKAKSKTAQSMIGDKGKSMVKRHNIQRRLADKRVFIKAKSKTAQSMKGDKGESMRRRIVEFVSEPIEIGDGWKSISKQELQVNKEQFMNLLASISKSVAKSTRNMPKPETVVPPRGSFKLGLISSLFDEMWNDMQQIVSTELKVLATCMFTPLAGHISALRLISADMEWLCTWVPEFAQKLECININEEIEEEEMEDGDKIEESMFASYISCWERTRSRGYCCRFEDPTILSPMLFTHYRPGHTPFFSGATRTMQIFSIKVTLLEGFEWPLEVFGVVAARDAVDYRRNILFLRTRDDCQSLTEHDSFLHLTGPARAIMSNDTVKIEVQLKVKGTTKSKDRALITRAFSCNGGHLDGVFTRSVDGYFCRIDLNCEHFGQSIQATILSVRVKEGSLPSKNGLQVICSALPEENVEDKECTSRHIVLLDQKDGTIPVDEEGYLDLSRQVVSVKLEGRLEVLIKTFPESGDICDCAVFTPQSSNISEKTCVLGECELEIIVAWSFLVDDQQSILMMSYTEPVTSSPFPFMKLDGDAGDGTS